MTDKEKLNEILNEEDFNRIDTIIMAGHDIELSNKLNKYCYCAEKLEEENEELKKQLEGNFDEFTFNKAVEVMNEYDNLKKENAELSNSVTELTNAKTELENKVTELEKQIKKMRNCGNCNGIIYGVRQEKCHSCMRSKLLAEWELAEE